MAMSEQKRYDTVKRIIYDDSIKVPDYLDNSITSKVIYALGMNDKPKIISDAAFDKRFGTTFYRTVDNSSSKMTASDILNQIKTSDYTQMSNKGGSIHGRAIYFADNFSDSALYGNNKSAQVMRAKIKPNANIARGNTINVLKGKIENSFHFGSVQADADLYALAAITHGYDGWYDGANHSYLMIVNRGALVTTSKNKMAMKTNGQIYSNWDLAHDA